MKELSEIEEKYFERKKILDDLRKYREGKEYLLTCYIITYNQQDTIAQCIESMLEQKTKYPYFIKILDDCSNDNTFDICLEYAKKYPEKIELNTVMHNSGGKLLTVAYENINTKYFCRTDGDDYWCNVDKIEKALDFLENHDEYVAYATDNLVLDTIKNKKLSNVHDLEPNKNISNEISFENFFYIHVSARIHRNVLDFKNKYKNFRKRDRILWYLFLDAGKVYYEDTISSVYRLTRNGFYAGSPFSHQQLNRYLICYKMNKHLKYKYDECFSNQIYSKKFRKLKKIVGKRLGWKVYILYCVFKIYKNAIVNNKKSIKKIDKFSGNFQKEEFTIIDRVREEII